MSSLLGLPLEWITNRLFAFRPKVTKEGGLLVARSDWRSQLFSLGFASRTATVDPKLKTVRLGVRRAWVFRTWRCIEFDRIDEVLYGYNDLSSDWGAHTTADLFTVGLRLKTGEEVVLFRFYGAGDFTNAGIWPDWMYWDDFLVSPYLKGTQEGESLLYADLLSRMIGVPIGNPRP
jgi:hypothetical protein